MGQDHTGPSAAELLDDLLASDHEIADFLNQLAHLAAVELTDELPVLVGITLERNKRSTIVGSSDTSSRKIDEVQAGFDEGPCLEAQSSHRLIEVPDVRTETRWPDYMEVIRKLGLRSVLAVPLDLGDTAQAAMNFYTTAPDAFNADRTASAQHFAKLASKALRVAVRIARYMELSEDRQAAMESRTSIDIAIGITMAQTRCSQEEAVTILKTASSHRNVKLRELAEDLVSSLGHSSPVTAFDN